MLEMKFVPIDESLRWEQVAEPFWLQLLDTFEDYRETARVDIDVLSVQALAENVFYEGCAYKPTLYLDPASAMALRRLYLFYRLRTRKFDEFLYQFEEMVRDIEGYFEAAGRPVSNLKEF